MKQLIRSLLLSATFLGAWSALQAQTPVANYSFSGNAKDTYGNHAAVHGARLGADRFGNANGAFYFDGAQAYLQAPNSAALNSDYSTLAFWVKPTTLPAQGEVYLVSFGGWQERFKVSVPTHGKCIWTTNGSNGISDMDAGDGNALVPGTWSHVVFVHDNSKDRIYLNGVQVAEKNVGGTLSSTDKPLGIGYDAIGLGNYFDGALDEVMLFGSALSAAEIAALYAAQNTAPAIPNGIVAAYPFSGDAQDLSAFANHAQATNVASATDRFGFGKSAYYFESAKSAGVVAPNSAVLNSAYTTISFWVKPSAFPVSGEAFLLSNGGWQQRWKISLPSHGKPVFTTHAGGACCSDMDSGTPLALGAWTHVVMTHDGTKDIIYFNGVQVAEKNVSGALDPTTHPFGIGFDPIDKAGYFDGAINDVAILNVALGPLEVAALYATGSTFPGVASDQVAEYELNGNGLDNTQYGNDARVGGVAGTDRHGWANNAMVFDGTENSGAVADNSPALNSDFTTISFWVKPTEFPVSGEVFLFSNGGWQERLKISLPGHGKPVFTTHAGGACCSDMDSGTPLALGAWTHVAMTHDGAKDIIYFNGVKVAEKNVSGALDKTKHPLGIGFDPIDNSGYFKGAMDEVQVYKRALSEAEIAALFAAQNSAPVVAGDLIANYTFNGNTEDHTAYQNHASVISAQTAQDRFGKSNHAYRFNGQSGLVAANSPQQNSPNTTISFWIKPDAFPVSGEAYLLSNGGWQERWKISLPGHGKPVFTTHAGGACCSDMDSGTPLALGAWTHVVMTHDGAKDIIYFNGAKVAEKNVTGALDATVHPLGIGFDPIDNANYFQGALDEVQLYKRALSEAEVAALYNTQNTAPAAIDTEAPCAPLNLAANVFFTNITLSWLPAEDNVGVVAYNVYRNGQLEQTVAETQAYFPALQQLTPYVFAVSALDAAGNESLLSSLNVTSGEEQTPDVTPPSAPANLQASTGANSVLFSWDASTDDRSVEGYVVQLDGVFFDSIPATQVSIFIGGLDSETPYTLGVYAYDKAGNDSPIAELDITTEDEIDTGEPGLVAHYPFEGNANDATPYANHGVPGGNVSYVTANHPNGGLQAVKFDGQADSILAPNAVQLISDFTTVAFWIRVDETNPLDPESYVLDFGHWDQRWKISLPQHLKIVWTTNSKTTQFPSLISDMDSGDGNEMVKGFWWHVAMVHDGTNDKIYVNGQLANSKPAQGKLNTTARPLAMGNNPIEGGQYFNGSLDELKIYNRAITNAEAENLFNSGTTGLNDLAQDGLQGFIHAVFPIPSSTVLHVKHQFSNQALQLRVFDVQGRQIDAIRYDAGEIPAGQLSLKTEAYPQGKYFLNFVLNGKSIGSVRFSKL